MEINREEGANMTRHEVEVDTKLAEIWTEAAAVEAKIESNRVSVAHSLHIRGEYYGRSRVPYFPAWSELQERAQRALTDTSTLPWDARSIREKLAEHDTLVARRGALAYRAAPLEAEYAAAPWSRFFLVQNVGGHIHSSMHCSTCHPTTSFGWLPALSGLTEKDAVDAHGAILCTVCFPSAPVEWTNAHELAAAQRAEGRCPGSGTYDHDSSGLRYASPRARCRHCQQVVSVTSTHKLRAHKKGA